MRPSHDHPFDCYSLRTLRDGRVYTGCGWPLRRLLLGRVAGRPVFPSESQRFIYLFLSDLRVSRPPLQGPPQVDCRAESDPTEAWQRPQRRPGTEQRLQDLAKGGYCPPCCVSRRAPRRVAATTFSCKTSYGQKLRKAYQHCVLLSIFACFA